MAHNLLGNMSQLNPKREATPPAHAGTEAEEPVRGKKALKKHLQRSIDKRQQNTRTKKAFAQLEESEKAVESKRKAMQ